MKQGLLGIEAEVEFGCDDDAMLSEMLDTGIVILPLSDKKIRISANADQVSAVVAILINQEIPRCLVFFNRSNSAGGIQKTHILTSKKLTDPTNENYGVSLKVNRKWGYHNHDTKLFDSLVQKRGINYV